MPDQPFLLEGLDTLLRLGWLTDGQVRHLCQENLVCALARSPLTTTVLSREQSFASDAGKQLAGAITDFKIEEPGSSVASKPPTVRAGEVIAGMMRSLVANFSVIWLLLLGVFLVLVSSIVLAAILWQDFPPVGQYSILLGYTLAFWGAGQWTGRQTNLQLTSRMLQIASLLLVPINFWTMDGFRLWSQFPGIGFAAISTCLLTGMTYLLLKPIAPLTSGDKSYWLIFNSMALSWLHWGWSYRGLPWLATYLGTIGTVGLQLYLFDGRQEAGGRRQEAEVASDVDSSPVSSPLFLALISITISLLLLLTRAVFVKQIPISQMGLALGICGWLLVWLARRDRDRQSWVQAGAVLLLLGWWVAVPEPLPWQALAVSGLGMSLLAERVWRLARRRDLTALFLVGLQTCWLIQQLVPLAWRVVLLDRVARWVGNEGLPTAFLGVSVFPYVLLILWLALRFRRWQQSRLAIHAERLALILGVLLTGVSLANDGVRSLNLILSTATLVWVLRDRSTTPWWLIYLTHTAGLLAIFSSIDFLYPGLTPTLWAAILLVGMLAEWALSTVATQLTGSWQVWRESAWYAGLLLAACSYTLLWNAFWLNQAPWTGIWLVTPLALTVLASLPQALYPQTAAGLSMGALILVQTLTLSSDSFRLVSLGLATGLMVLNTVRLPYLLLSFVTIGFGLLFTFVATWEICDRNLSMEWGINLLTIAVALLWFWWSWLIRRQTELSRQYAIAANSWAIVLTLMGLLFLSLYWGISYFDESAVDWEYGLATVILFTAIAYRHWQHPHAISLYGLAWSLELIVISTTATLANKSLDVLGMTNLALALTTQLAGDWWLIQHLNDSSSPPLFAPPSSQDPPSAAASPSASRSLPLSPAASPSPLHTIPLIYTLMGLVIQHHEFTAYTGLYTLAGALVGIGVGRRDHAFKPLTYLSVLAASFGAYEVLIYQLSQAEAGSAGDGITLLAALATAIAIAEQLLSRWLTIYCRLEKREIATIAHLHWLISNGFLWLAILSPLSALGKWIWLGIVAIQSVYALATGRINAQEESAVTADHRFFSVSFWAYAGIWEYLLGLAYLLHLLLPDRVLLEWGTAIACVAAYLMYRLPWRTLGWLPLPWQQSALVLPAIVLMFTAWSIAIPGLLIVAAFYAWIARDSNQIRLSYLSVLLADWAIIRWMLKYHATEPLYFSTVIGCSLLYIAQVDPNLRSSNERNNRHWLRCLAIGLICATALYQSENSLFFSLITIVLGIVLIMAGLALRIRAFLYLGTATFLIKLLWQVWSYVNQYSQLIWAIGILIGLGFIWVAATFESRRTQLGVLIQFWLDELQEWQ
jgi:hypothetical protein